MSTNKPNILLITTDQQRKDSIGAYNSKLSTPALDSIAADGVIFDRAYIAHPTCTPSRASLLTGQYASKHGAYTIGTALSEDSLKVTDVLNENGYETYLVGKPHFQQISTEGTAECFSKAMDEDFWSSFTGPYYGFNNVSIFNGHSNYPITAGMHYRIWLKEKGLSDEDISNYFNHISTDKFREHGAWDIPREYHPSVFVSEATAKYLEAHREKKEDKPFFMWCSFVDPHDPHVVPEPYASMYSPDEIDYNPHKEGELDNMPSYYNELYEKDFKNVSFGDSIGLPSAPSAKIFGDDKYFREITAVHHGMVKLVDEEIEKIINKLKELGIYDNTLIVFTTDHGDYLGNHGFLYKGFPSYEEVYNVPYIVKNVAQANQGSRSGALISHVDFAGTVLSAAGIEIPAEMDSINQMPVFKGEKESIRTAVVIENRPIECGFYQHMLVTDNYKVVAYMDSKEGELFDLANDPNQYNNLWNDTKYNSLKQDLLNQLLNRLVLPKYKKSISDLPIDSCLEAISKKMHEEEPVQRRTSFS